MERGVTYRSLIEYFLLMQDGGNSNKLIYYDQEGTRFEKPIERGQIEHALKKFDGGPKAVGRSSGGVVRAIPYQLVLSEEPYGEVTPQPKIRVKFREFKRDTRGNIIRGLYDTVSKVVEPNQLIDMFQYEVRGPQRFLMDFGRGIVPIYLIRCAIDRSNQVQALFVELDAIEQCLIERPSSEKKVPIQIYQVHRDMVRLACGANARGYDEFDLALENYRRQKEEGIEVIPASLHCAAPFDAASGMTYQEFRQTACRSLKQMLQGKKLSFHTTTVVRETGEEELVPFGAYEDNAG